MRLHSLLTLAAIATLAPRLAAQTQDPAPSYAELVAQVKALQAQVDRLQAAQSSQLSQAQVQETVRQVMADAEKRSRVLDLSNVTAGWNGERFTLRSADNKFAINPLLVYQGRYVANYRQSTPASSDPAAEEGFENRRFRLGADGSFFDERLTYKFVLAVDRGQSAALTDAYTQYQFTPDLAVRVGQFKDFWTHEENVSDSKLLAVERPLLNALIGGTNTNWVQGAELLLGQGKPARAQFALHDGANSRDTTFRDTPASTELPLLGAANVDYGATARVEFFAAGTPKQYEDYSALNNKENLLVFGAGADFTQAGDNHGLFHAVDAEWENTHGTSLFAEYIALYRQIGTPSTGAQGVNAGDFYDYGLLAQVGQMVAPKVELFARYDWIQLDDAAFPTDRPVRQDQVQEITVGGVYYIYRHACKLTIDLSYLPDGSPDAPGLGYIATDENSFVLRTQFQLAL